MKQNGSTSRVCNVCGEPATHYDVQPDTDYCDEHFIDYNEGMADKYAICDEDLASDGYPEDDAQLYPYDST